MKKAARAAFFCRPTRRPPPSRRHPRPRCGSLDGIAKQPQDDRPHTLCWADCFAAGADYGPCRKANCVRGAEKAGHFAPLWRNVRSGGEVGDRSGAPEVVDDEGAGRPDGAGPASGDEHPSSGDVHGFERRQEGPLLLAVDEAAAVWYLFTDVSHSFCQLKGGQWS